ncbi:MAG: hypothetical protein NT062_19250 [Proteobacteria bacterium]|nr:hypothetical protein [Pseudomonadota bacterium]
MLHRCVLVAVTVAGVAGLSGSAAADPFKVFGQVEGGAMVGTGTSGIAKDSAFFGKSPHATYGAEVGAEIFFIDAYVNHHQYTDGTRLTTWTKFGLGMHFEIDFDKEPPQFESNAKSAEPKQDKKKPKKDGGFAEVGLGVYFGLGTGQQVDPPLDNSEITDKAVQVEGRFTLGTHLNNVLDFGVALPVSYGYFIKNGADVVANNLDNHYRGVQAELLLFVRANLRFL